MWQKQKILHSFQKEIPTQKNICERLFLKNLQRKKDLTIIVYFNSSSWKFSDLHLFAAILMECVCLERKEIWNEEH